MDEGYPDLAAEIKVELNRDSGSNGVSVRVRASGYASTKYDAAMVSAATSMVAKLIGIIVTLDRDKAAELVDGLFTELAAWKTVDVVMSLADQAAKSEQEQNDFEVPRSFEDFIDNLDVEKKLDSDTE